MFSPDLFAESATDSTTEVSYLDALQLAAQLHRGGQLDPAEKLYRALRRVDPSDPNPVHYLGVLLHQRGHDDEALAMIRESIGVDERVAPWHNNLGNVLLGLGRTAQAVDAYKRCIELDPGNVEVLNNLGVMQRKCKLYADAEATFKLAIERRPDFADAHSNLATLYYQQSRVLEGYAASAAALALQPAHSGARRMLALVYARLGRLDDAAALYREWLDNEPGDVQAQHYLAACGGADAPDRASDAYVERVFDAFADSFDAKLASLDYCAPQLVAGAVRKVLGDAPDASLAIVDAGCGTGLCAPFLAPYAATLVGVDLSANMLDRARQRGLYTSLVRAELVAFLQASQTTADLITCADTFCYFGKLEDAFNAARNALVRGGHFVFTVEAHSEPVGYRLNVHGRYSHRHDYVRRVLLEAGFADVVFESAVLRYESGAPVDGWVVTARRAGGPQAPR